ncbi:MAG: hypothetical protein MUF49_04990 [Oculatellaceae cyanobacterium Prado106]|jgi:hypothetical protein|nr:hypothetical protein [Oculatellaceae cyanobacterium Prado106]
MRRAIFFSMVVLLGVVSTACSSPNLTASADNPAQPQATAPQTANPSANLSDGQYPVQQATYDDGAGEYRLALLNTAPGQSSMVQFTNLPMARLTEEELSSGQTSYLKVESGQPSLHLTEDFKIEYVHNVTETVANPQTGQTETVIVRRESNFWTPFAGALAGQAIGSLLFTPHYYIPPVYRPGGALIGYGGYGRTYDQAVTRYRDRYQAPPAEVKNRQVFRSTGRLRNPTNAAPSSSRNSPGQVRSTGSGYGTSTLRQRDSNRQLQQRRPSSFGSGSRSRRPARRR